MSYNKNREYVRTLHDMIADFLRDNPASSGSDQEIWDWLEKKENAESEDERIRKALIGFVEQYVSIAENREGMLAYLEKQKEQKPLSTEETELNSIAFLEQLGYTCVPPGKEHKPVDDELEDAIKLYYETYGNGEGGFYYLSYSKFEDIVKTFVNDYGKQKPAEWSEEDENWVKAVINNDGLTNHRKIELLNSRCRNAHWKPTEEQMKALNTVANEGVLLDLFNDLLKLF